VEEVVVDEIEGEGDYYHARVAVRQHGRREVVDIRPSDAFGLAIACDVPIFIVDDVLVRAAELGWTEPPS
jgi:bifunctional DNase/RNase